MSDQATVTGVLLPGKATWGAYTRKDGTQAEAGERPICHVYDPHSMTLVGPIDVPKALRDHFATVPQFAEVRVVYSTFAKARGQMDRTLSSLTAAQPASK